MRRHVVHDSDEEHEPPKTVRRTRAALAAASTEASPMRRSTRIRQGSVNPDGSSPESLNGSQAREPVARVTRRRAAVVAESAHTLDVPRTLRSRKNSVSSNISEIIDVDSAPSTPRKYKRPVTIQSSPDTPKPKSTRRSTRATSETKSPAPVATSTRRTRANSIEPEPVATPTRRRRTQVSAPPTEPSVTEDADEDDSEVTPKSKLDDVLEVPEETPANSGKKSSRRSSSSSSKKSPKKDEPDVEPDAEESIIDKDVSSVKNEQVVDPAEEAELLKTPHVVQKESDSSAPDIADGETFGKQLQKTASPLIIVGKRASLDKSRELGEQIESLLNKSSEELAHSPGDKENQKVNISPEKVRKNLEVTVSNVNIVRSQPVGFEFVNKSFETKINTWLEDRGLAKSRYETVSPVPNDIHSQAGEEREATETRIFVKKGSKSPEKKSNSKTASPKRNDVEENEKESNSETKSPKKIDKAAKKELGTTESGKKKKKNRRLNVERTVVDNIIVQELTLSESNSSDESQSEFSLAIEEDTIDKEKKIGAADTSSTKKSKKDEPEASDSDEEILERNSPKKHDSSKKKEEDVQGNNSKILHVNLKRLEDKGEERRRASLEKLKEPESKSNGIEEEKNSSNDTVEPMDTHEDKGENCTSEALDADLISFEESELLVNGKNKSLTADEPRRKSLIDSEIDSDVVVNTLFQNISAEEWRKKRQSKRKSSILTSYDSDNDDLITVGDKTMFEDEVESDSDSEDTLVLQKPTNKKKKPVDDAILEEAETQDDEPEEKTKKKRNSLNKSTKSNTSLIENETEAEEAKDNSRKSIGKTKEEKEEDNLSKAETITTNNRKKSTGGNTIDEAETDDEGKTKKQRKSLNKSTKSNASLMEIEMEVDEVEDTNRKSISNSSEDKEDLVENVSIENSVVLMEEEDEAEESRPGSAKKTPKKSNNFETPEKSETENEEDSFVDAKLKTAEKSKLRKVKTPSSRNYSIIADVDSDSMKGDVSDSSDDEKVSIPGFLFSVESSGNEDEDYNPNASENDSNETIDSDIAKELNLAGDDDVKYSDDDVEADECRESESEDDEEDEGSDMADFVVPDDEVESSEEEEEEEEEVVEDPVSKSKFKRILDKSSSEDEEEEHESVQDVEESPPVVAEKSVDETPEEEEPALIPSKPSRRTLDYSPESATKSTSSKKSKRMSEPKDLKLISGAVMALLDQTVDLCTPEQAELETRRKSSGKRDRSMNNLKKNLVEDLAAFTPDQRDATKEEKAKTPNSGKKDKRAALKTPEATMEGQDNNKTPNLSKKEKRAALKTPEATKEEKDNNKTPNSSKKEKRAALKTPEATEEEKDNNKTPNSSKKEKRATLKTPEATKEEKDNNKTPNSSKKEKRAALKTPEATKEEKDNNKTPNSSKKEKLAALRTPEATKEEKDNNKTPNSSKKEKRAALKTPEAANKNRDSIQLIKDLDSLTKPSISDLNKSMSTPNSLTPVTKFLKKERLNESLPFIDLKRTSGKSFDKVALSQMREDEEPSENHKQKDTSEESGDEEEATNDEAEENGDEINSNGHREDEEDDDTDEEPEKDEENGGENEDEDENDDEETEESSDEGEIVFETKRNSKHNLGRPSTSTVINGDAESDGEVVISTKKGQLLNPALLQLPNEKKRPRSTTSCETPQSMKKTKKFKIAPQTEENENENESDSDDAPVSLGFGKAKTEALKAMKKVSESLKAGKEAKKKKRRDQLERIRQEKETKAAQTNLKRLPEDILENLSDLPERPKKKRKISKKEETVLPSRTMFSPGKTPPGLSIEEADSPVSAVGGTTQFSVVNLEKVKKQPKKAAAAASFRDQMLARNPRQPVSAFLMYKAKQKASGKALTRKRA